MIPNLGKTVDIIFGILLSCVFAYLLPKYIDWVPDFSIWIFLLIVGINLTQCLPNQRTPS
jgi:hypothetical protein